MRQNQICKLASSAVLFVLAPVSLGISMVVYLAVAGFLGEKLSGRMWGGCFTNSIALSAHLVLSIHGPSFKEVHENVRSKLRMQPLSIVTFFVGCCGSYALFCGVYVPKYIGFSVYSITLVCFEIIASFIVESFGICWIAVVKPRGKAMLGCLTLLSGTFIFQYRRMESIQTFGGQFYVCAVCLVLTVIAGFAVVLLSSGNSKLKTIVMTPFRALTISVGVSTSIVVLASSILLPPPRVGDLSFSDYGLFFGGFVGAYTMFLLATLPQRIGLASTIGWKIFGQMSTALVIDKFGLWGSKKIDPTLVEFSGLALCLVGIVLVQINRAEATSEAAILDKQVSKTASKLYGATINSVKLDESVV